MKTTTLLAPIVLLLVALPAQASSYDDLTVWPLEDLCEKLSKNKHADTVLAEIERRNSFSTSDFGLIRDGRIDLGMDRAALQCVWGAPDSVGGRDDDVWQTFRPRIDGRQLTVDVHVVAGGVTEIQVRPQMRREAPRFTRSNSLMINLETFSGRSIGAAGVGPIPCAVNCLRRPIYTTDVPP